jgi:hypothetical protein
MTCLFLLRELALPTLRTTILGAALLVLSLWPLDWLCVLSHHISLGTPTEVALATGLAVVALAVVLVGALPRRCWELDLLLLFVCTVGSGGRRSVATISHVCTLQGWN